MDLKVELDTSLGPLFLTGRANAYVGQSIAEELLRSQNELARDCISVDVVEAACLGHDVGRPPFGHTAEDELKDIADHAGLPDRFEGNAQSFRIVTKLAFRSLEHQGP